MKKVTKKMIGVLAAFALTFAGCTTEVDTTPVENTENQGGGSSGGSSETPDDGSGDSSGGNTENPGGSGDSGGTSGGSGDSGNTPGESPVDKPTIGDVSNCEVKIVKSEGVFNSAYIIFEQIEGATYEVYCDDVKIDEPLIRFYDEYVYNTYDETTSKWTEGKYSKVVRADALGLKAGSHTMKVCAVGTENTSDFSSSTMEVSDYDRQGFAFTGTQTPGAYNADGTLKDGAVVIYVTDETAKTVTYNGQTGFQAILSESFVKKLTTPLCIRVIGTVKDSSMDSLGSSAEGLQIKGNKSPITLEGVGHDASINGFGMLLRSSQYVEVSNLGIFNFMDDGISIDTGNQYLWIHNNEVFYGKVGGDADQAKGDGAIDFKKSTYGTISYNHFWDSGKSCLLDASASSSGGSNYLTYHHNWFDHSDSRHPRIRNASAVHVYNNYFDGNSKYGTGITSGASCFSEGNYFRNVKYPLMSSNQGSDISWGNHGTFSGEAGGTIKSYNNFMSETYTFIPYGAASYVRSGTEITADVDTKAHFDAYVVQNRTDTVPDTVKTLDGSNVYSNFDTQMGDSGLGLTSVPTDPNVAKSDVVNFAGRHNPDFIWNFDNSVDDTSYAVNTGLKNAVTNYKSNFVTVQNYIEGQVSGSTDSGSGDSGSGDSGNTGESGGGSEPTVVTGSIFTLTGAGDFTCDWGTVSVTGNMKSGVAEKDYGGQTFTTALKMESSTSIKITLTEAKKLTFITDATAAKKIKIDGRTDNSTDVSGNLVSVSLEAGEHTISKGDSLNLYAIIAE